MFLFKKYLPLVLALIPLSVFGVSVKNVQQFQKSGSRYLNNLADKVELVNDASGVLSLANELGSVEGITFEGTYGGLESSSFVKLTQFKSAHANLVSKLNALVLRIDKMTPNKQLANGIQAVVDFWNGSKFVNSITSKRSSKSNTFFKSFNDVNVKLTALAEKFAASSEATQPTQPKEAEDAAAQIKELENRVAALADVEQLQAKLEQVEKDTEKVAADLKAAEQKAENAVSQGGENATPAKGILDKIKGLLGFADENTKQVDTSQADLEIVAKERKEAEQKLARIAKATPNEQSSSVNTSLLSQLQQKIKEMEDKKAAAAKKTAEIAENIKQLDAKIDTLESKLPSKGETKEDELATLLKKWVAMLKPIKTGFEAYPLAGKQKIQSELEGENGVAWDDFSKSKKEYFGENEFWEIVDTVRGITVKSDDGALSLISPYEYGKGRYVDLTTLGFDVDDSILLTSLKSADYESINTTLVNLKNLAEAYAYMAVLDKMLKNAENAGKNAEKSWFKSSLPSGWKTSIAAAKRDLTIDRAVFESYVKEKLGLSNFSVKSISNICSDNDNSAKIVGLKQNAKATYSRFRTKKYKGNKTIREWVLELKGITQDKSNEDISLEDLFKTSDTTPVPSVPETKSTINNKYEVAEAAADKLNTMMQSEPNSPYGFEKQFIVALKAIYALDKLTAQQANNLAIELNSAISKALEKFGEKYPVIHTGDLGFGFEEIGSKFVDALTQKTFMNKYPDFAGLF